MGFSDMGPPEGRLTSLSKRVSPETLRLDDPGLTGSLRPPIPLLLPLLVREAAAPAW